MRLIVNGQQAFGKAALEKILEAGVDEVVAVYTAPDKEGRPADPVKEAALEHGIPLYQPASYKDEAVLEEMRALNADLMIMAYVIIFIPEAARDVPKMGSICFHPSLLPLHRGPSSINWPIIWGSTKTGYSWFYPTDGLDEGEILLQREVDIGPDDTLGDRLFQEDLPRRHRLRARGRRRLPVRQYAPDGAGRFEGNLRELVQEGGRGNRLVETRSRGL